MVDKTWFCIYIKTKYYYYFELHTEEHLPGVWQPGRESHESKHQPIQCHRLRVLSGLTLNSTYMPQTEEEATSELKKHFIWLLRGVKAHQHVSVYLVGCLSRIEALRVENTQIHSSIRVTFGISFFPQMYSLLVVLLVLLVVPAQSGDSGNRPLQEVQITYRSWIEWYTLNMSVKTMKHMSVYYIQ